VVSRPIWVGRSVGRFDWAPGREGGLEGSAGRLAWRSCSVVEAAETLTLAASQSLLPFAIHVQCWDKRRCDTVLFMGPSVVADEKPVGRHIINDYLERCESA